MWTLTVPWWELIIRGAMVYLFLLVLLRITGKRQVGHLAPFDLVLLLVLSNSLQNAMNGGDMSFTGGVLTAATLVGLNYLVGWLTYKNKKLEALVEGRPIVLIHNGKIIHEALSEVRMTTHELNTALRNQGLTRPDEVLVAVLENSGEVTIVPRKPK